MIKVNFVYEIHDYYVDAIINTLNFAYIQYTTNEGEDTYIEFLPNSEYNYCDCSISIKGKSSIFLTVSRIAHTFSSDPVNAGLIDMNIRWVENATLTDVESWLSDGKFWLCPDFQQATAADVLLYHRLQKFDLCKYPCLYKYKNRIPLKY